ncbi:MAG TPA: DUF3787 domain-containing protein [Clostridiales bacterium]|nr:DUF3787 domain-containing protein [Clostridiales bacterium]
MAINNINPKEQLKGKDNKRINSKTPTNCECTAAWQNQEGYYKADQVNINKPSLDAVIAAKDWVDNGSKL